MKLHVISNSSLLPESHVVRSLRLIYTALVSSLVMPGLFSLTSCDSTGPSAHSQTTEPRLTIPESTFTFGYAPQQSIVSHSFWLQSTGGDTLRIVKISPG